MNTEIVKQLSLRAVQKLRARDCPELPELEPRLIEKILALREEHDQLLIELVVRECAVFACHSADKEAMKKHFGVE